MKGKVGFLQNRSISMVFAIACSGNNIQSAVKILERLHKLGATRAEITDAMMLAAWTGGNPVFHGFQCSIA